MPARAEGRGGSSRPIHPHVGFARDAVQVQDLFHHLGEAACGSQFYLGNARSSGGGLPGADVPLDTQTLRVSATPLGRRGARPPRRVHALMLSSRRGPGERAIRPLPSHPAAAALPAAEVHVRGAHLLAEELVMARDSTRPLLAELAGGRGRSRWRLFHGANAARNPRGSAIRARLPAAQGCRSPRSRARPAAGRSRPARPSPFPCGAPPARATLPR